MDKGKVKLNTEQAILWARKRIVLLKWDDFDKIYDDIKKDHPEIDWMDSVSQERLMQIIKRLLADEKEKNEEVLKKEALLAERQVMDSGGDSLETGLPQIILPQLGKLISDFAYECADVLKDKGVLFFRGDSREIVEIGKIHDGEDGEERYTGFLSVRPNRFITLAEKYFLPMIEVRNKQTGERFYKEKSMMSDVANTLLSSEILQEAMPLINRIFTVPIPIMYKGELTFPQKGYDRRFFSWLTFDAPEISKPDMPLDEARNIIYTILKEFPFQTRQDYINAIAGILTPFLRGLFPTFNTRTPSFFYVANRERAGKDYLAGITGIIYEGYALEEPPISTTENQKSNNTEELTKRILAALISGRKRMHFANNKGFINNSVFEMIVTAERYSGRVLGKNELLTFDNELDFSLSGNTGIGYTPDFANRCRFVRLLLDIEDANSRVFENPNLHGWLKKNRGLILSALYALVRNWIATGSVFGTVPFSSFPQWAAVCGGIMEAAGYESPCKTDKDLLAIGGDVETMDMKSLFELCYEEYPEQYISKAQIRELITDPEKNVVNMFGYLDFTQRADQTKFGNKIIKFVGRVLSDIQLQVEDASVRAARQKLMFTKEKKVIDRKEIFESGKDNGNLGNNGNHYTPKTSLEVDGNDKGNTLPTLPRLPQEELTKQLVSNPSSDKIGLCYICSKAATTQIEDEISHKPLWICNQCIKDGTV